MDLKSTEWPTQSHKTSKRTEQVGKQLNGSKEVCRLKWKEENDLTLGCMLFFKTWDVLFFS